MNTLIKSLKRLYDLGKVNLVKLEELKASGKVSQENIDYIAGNK